MEKRYGKQMRFDLKAIIKEDGKTRIIFYSFPNYKFDSPKNCLYHAVGWFLKNFPEFDGLDAALAGIWFDKQEAKGIAAKEKIKEWVHNGIEKERPKEIEEINNE